MQPPGGHVADYDRETAAGAQLSSGEFGGVCRTCDIVFPTPEEYVLGGPDAYRQNATGYEMKVGK